ncbi:hypothetical protein ACHWQZ_G001333 [Mnemiopsis leidyi]
MFQLSREDGSLITDEEKGFLLYNSERLCYQYRSDFDIFTANTICRWMGFYAANDFDKDPRSSDFGSWSRHLFGCRQDINGSPECIKVNLKNRYDCAYFIQLECSYSCQQGKFVEDGACHECPENTYRATQGRLTSCQDCPEGSTSQFNASSCICDRGSYWQEGSCLPCTSQICNCPKGMTWNGDNLERGTCVPCKPGTYRREDMMVCTTCPSGSTSTEGQDYCLCTAGFFWDGAGCVECGDGRVSPAGARLCQPCPGETTSNKSNCDCPNGQVWTWKTADIGHCSLCPPGTYKNSVQGSCTSCPTEAISLAGSSSCLCPAGTTWSDTKLNCEECEPGQVSQAGSLKCTECPDGSVDKVTCSCKIGHVWYLCVSLSESRNDNDSLILAITIGITTIICFCLLGLYVKELRKDKRKNSTKEFFTQAKLSLDNKTIVAPPGQHLDLNIRLQEREIADKYNNWESKSERKSNFQIDESLQNTATANKGLYDTLNYITAPLHEDGETSVSSEQMCIVSRNSKPTSATADGRRDVTAGSTKDLYQVSRRTMTAPHDTLEYEDVFIKPGDVKQVKVSKERRGEEIVEENVDCAVVEEISQCSKRGGEVYSTLEEVQEEEDGEAVYTKLNR